MNEAEIFFTAISVGKKKFLVHETSAQFLSLPKGRRNVDESSISVVFRPRRAPSMAINFRGPTARPQTTENISII